MVYPADEIPDRNPLFIFEQAIDEVLALPSADHDACANMASDNLLGATADFDSWERLATAWLGQYLHLYNECLYDCAPDALDDLEEVVFDLQEEEVVSSDEVLDIVEYYLS